MVVNRNPIVCCQSHIPPTRQSTLSKFINNFFHLSCSQTDQQRQKHDLLVGDNEKPQ